MWSARAKAREAKRRSAFYCSIDLAAPLAVVLVLLAIFMVDAPPIVHGVSTDLTAVCHATYQPGSRKEDALRVLITRDGKLFFGNSIANPDDLPDHIREALRNGSERRVYLAVDARARYADIAVVVDQIRLVGLQNITFLTEQQRAPSPPSPQTN